MELPGIYVEIKGDYTQLQQQLREAKALVTQQATGISNALNNAISPKQISTSLNKIVADFGTLNRAAGVTGKTFSQLGVDIGELRKITGLTGQQFEKLQSQLLKTQAANAQEKALSRIAAACNLTEKEIRELGHQFGLSAAQINKVANSTKTAETSFLTLGGVVRAAIAAFSVQQMAGFAKAVLDTGIQVDALNRSFLAISGSQMAAAKDMDFLRAVAERTGQNMYALADGYRQLTASTKGTNLEGEKTKRVFEAMSEAAAVLGLSQEKIDLSLKAMAQMASKGVVQMEELKGQLGDHLPGAVQIAARAMGVTTAELIKMSASGELLAEDLLPKLAAELHNMYGAAAQTAALDSGQAAVNQLSEAWTGFKNNIYESTKDFIIPAIRGVAAALKGLSDSGDIYGGLVPVNQRAFAGDFLKDKLAALNARRDALLNRDDEGGLTEGQIDLVRSLNTEIEKYAAALEKVDALGAVQIVPESVKKKVVSDDVFAKGREKLLKDIKTGKEEVEEWYKTALKYAQGKEEIGRIETLYSEKLATLAKKNEASAKRSIASAKKEEDAMERLLGKVLPLRKEQEEYTQQIEALDKALAAGRISQDEYAQGVQNASDSLTINKEKHKEAEKAVKDLAKAWKDYESNRRNVDLAAMTDQEREVALIRERYALIEQQIAQNVELGASEEWAGSRRAALAERMNDDLQAVNDNLNGMSKLFEDVAKNIQSAFSGMFEDLLDGTSNFMDSILDVFKKLLAQMATMAIARPVIIPLVAGIGGAMGVSNTAIAKTLGIDSSEIAGMGGLFSPGSMTGGLASALQSGASLAWDAGFNSLGNLAESAAGWLDGVAGGLSDGLLAGVGSLGMSLLSGNGITVKSGFQAGGAAIGAALGFGAPGAIIGGLLGNLAGGLFGDDPPEFEFDPTFYREKYNAADYADYLRTGGATGSRRARELNFGGKWDAVTGQLDSTFNPDLITPGTLTDGFKAYGEALVTIQDQYNKYIVSLSAALPKKAADVMMDALGNADYEQLLDAATSGRWDQADFGSKLEQVLAKYGESMWETLGNALGVGVQSFLDSEGAAGLVGSENVWGMLSDAVQANITRSFTTAADQMRGGDVDSGIAALTGVQSAIAAIGQAIAPIQEILDTNGLTDYELQLRAINQQFDAYKMQLQAAGVDMAKFVEFEQARGVALAKVMDVENERMEAEKERIDSGILIREIQIMELSGDTAGALAAQRAMELEAMEEAFRPLQERIYALQDEQAAAEAAAAAAGKFRHVLEEVASAANAALVEAESNLRNAFSAEQNRLSEQHSVTLERLNSQLGLAQDATQQLTSMTSTLRSAIRGMRLESDDFERSTRQQAQSTLQATLVAARRGQLDPSTDMSDMLDTLNQSSAGLFSNFEDYQRDFWKTYQSVVELESIAARQLSRQESETDLLRRQIEAENRWFEAEMDLLTQQLNSILNLDATVLSISDAITKYYAAQSAARDAQDQLGAAENGTGISADSYFAQKVAQLTAAGLMGTVFDGVMLASVEDVKRVFALQGLTPRQHWERFGKYEGLDRPSFAVGTDYVPGDMIAQVHKGERITPAAYNRSDATNAELVAEIRKLREELRQQNTTIAKNTAKTAEIIDKWDYDGMPAETM